MRLASDFTRELLLLENLERFIEECDDIRIPDDHKLQMIRGYVETLTKLYKGDEEIEGS